MNDDRPDSDADPGPEPPPHLDESVRRVAAAGRETLGSGRDTGRALRRLLRAELALARGAIVRALAWAVLALIFAVSTWLMMIVVLVTALHALGLGWLAASAAAGAICLVVTALAGWQVKAYFKHVGLHATRRQLTRLKRFQGADEGDNDPEPTPKPEAPAA